MNRKLRLIALVFGVGIPFLGTANATPITTYTTSYNTWKTTEITGAASDANVAPSGTSYNTAAGYSTATTGFTFTGPDNGGYNLSGQYLPAYGGADILAGPNDGVGYINIATPAGGENAFALYLTTSGSTNISLTLSDGETANFLTTNSAMGWYGFALTHPVNGLTLQTSAGSQVLLYDVVYGTSKLTQDGSGLNGNSLSDPPPAPESATLALVGGGLLVLLGSRRKIIQKMFVEKLHLLPKFSS